MSSGVTETFDRITQSEHLYDYNNVFFYYFSVQVFLCGFGCVVKMFFTHWCSFCLVLLNCNTDVSKRVKRHVCLILSISVSNQLTREAFQHGGNHSKAMLSDEFPQLGLSLPKELSEQLSAHSSLSPSQHLSVMKLWQGFRVLVSLVTSWQNAVFPPRQSCCPTGFPNKKQWYIGEGLMQAGSRWSDGLVQSQALLP